MSDSLIYFIAGLFAGFTAGGLTVILVLKSVVQEYMKKK